MDMVLSTYTSVLATLPRITSKFGAVEPGIHNRPHTGIDFAVPMGTKLLSTGDGVVDSVVNYGSTNVGKGVFIKLNNGVKLLYGHLDQVLVKPGQKVRAGDVIGLSGNTGHSTGPHLHLQAYDPGGKLIDPTSMAEGVFNKMAAFGLPSLDNLNPIKALNDRIDNTTYWCNPINWIKEAWHAVSTAVGSGAMDVPLLVFTIVCIWLIMLGAEKPKKWLFWTWVIFWLLRGVLCT